MGRIEELFRDGTKVINSATPWATTEEQLRRLYECEATAAVTVRTSTLHGFAHDAAVHQYTFFDAGQASLNTLGYSPIPLSQTLETIARIGYAKPWIVSITGAVDELRDCFRVLAAWVGACGNAAALLVEVNLSCPNIRGRPPPAFDVAGLRDYLGVIAEARREHGLVVGIKLPPYSNPDNFGILEAALQTVVRSEGGSEALLDFITTTNTLGCSLFLDNDLKPVLKSADGSGIGGLAGPPLHPLALGNVTLIRRMLDANETLAGIDIIGIGGVGDHAGFSRMRAAGASVVGVGTAYGVQGLSVFERIARPLEHGREFVGR